MNVRSTLIEYLLDEKLDMEKLDSDPWIGSLRQVMKDELSEKEILLHLREILYRILVWRRTYLSEGHFGEKVSAAYAELEKAERKLIWEGSETIFTPLYREAAKKYGDVRSIDRDLVRLEALFKVNPPGGSIKPKGRRKCLKCPSMAQT